MIYDAISPERAAEVQQKIKYSHSAPNSVFTTIYCCESPDHHIIDTIGHMHTYYGSPNEAYFAFLVNFRDIVADLQKRERCAYPAKLIKVVVPDNMQIPTMPFQRSLEGIRVLLSETDIALRNYVLCASAGGDIFLDSVEYYTIDKAYEKFFR